MASPTDRCDIIGLEVDKFREADSGGFCVAVCIEDSDVNIGSVNAKGEHNTTLPTLVDGELEDLQLDNRGRLITSTTASGLSIAGKVTEVTLSSGSWTALPSTALADRNGLAIQNDITEIKLNFDSGEAGYIGWKLASNGETFLDITDAVIIYAKAASGTPTIVVMEVS